MQLPRPLVSGKIKKRYKRFLADIELDSGELITAHIANTGSMRTCWEPGWKTLLTKTNDPKRKLKYSVQLIHNGSTWIGINTSLPNKLVKEALEAAAIQELAGYKVMKPEYKVGKSRLDFFLDEHPADKKCYVEIKNVTLLGENGVALFPDAVSTRGHKHLEELTDLKKNEDCRAAMLYIVQREDVEKFRPADHIDPKYATLLKTAHKQGVEVLVYQCHMNETEIVLRKKLPYEL